MKVRYKNNGQLAWSSQFNILTLNEVLTGDDSVFISSLDVFIEAKQEWKDLRQAFKDRDVITDNYNSRFFEPQNEEDRKRGYTLY